MRYLVTGGGGFIGSNLVRRLLRMGASVRVLDDFSTGRRSNLQDIENDIELVEGSICDRALVAHVCRDVDYCLHQAAIPSVPRSIADPWTSNRANVEGTLNVFLASRDAGVHRVVFASSSSIYGNATELPVNEDLPRQPISPYGVTKATDEMFAETFSSLYDIDIVALRYFNVFGPRQDPKSQYAAVVPIFITCMLNGQPPTVDGDGLQARDFTFVDNVVEANIAACKPKDPIAGAYNIACETSVSVLALVQAINGALGTTIAPQFREPRAGDIRQSYASIKKAHSAFGYSPSVSFKDGIDQTVTWFRTHPEECI